VKLTYPVIRLRMVELELNSPIDLIICAIEEVGKENKSKNKLTLWTGAVVNVSRHNYYYA
jgi:hypothetical protein